MNRPTHSNRLPVAALALIAGLAAVAAGCYLAPILVSAEGELLMVVSLPESSTDENRFAVYSAKVEDPSSWKQIDEMSGSPTAAAWRDGRLWVFFGRDASVYRREGVGLVREVRSTGLEWDVEAAAFDDAGGLWCAGVHHGRLVACRLDETVEPGAKPVVAPGPAVGEAGMRIQCAPEGDSILVAWRSLQPGRDSAEIRLATVSSEGWGQVRSVAAPGGMMALVRSGDDGRLVLLVMGGTKPGRGGSILHESAFDGASWSPFAAVPGTEAGPGFGYIYFSAAETPGGFVCVRSNTQKLQVLSRRGGTWIIVESAEGLREGNMQLYVGGLLLLAAAMLGAGVIGLAKRLSGKAPPEPPPGWKAVAPMSRRGLAYVIDLFFVGSVLLMGLAAFEVDLLAIAASPGIQAVLYTLPLAYFVAAETIFGATAGKRLMGVTVVMTDGSPLTLVAAVVRNALRVFDGLPVASAIPVVGFVVASFTRRQQRIGDILARTVVVGRERTNAYSKGA